MATTDKSYVMEVEIQKGDWVKIKPRELIGFSTMGWTESMYEYCGQWHKVYAVESNCVGVEKIRLERITWIWTRDMISEVAYEWTGYPETGDIVMFDTDDNIKEKVEFPDGVLLWEKRVDGVLVVPSMILVDARQNEDVWIECRKGDATDRIAYYLNQIDECGKLLRGENTYSDYPRCFFKDVFLRKKNSEVKKSEIEQKHEFKKGDIVRFVSKERVKQIRNEFDAKQINRLLDFYNNLYYVESVDEDRVKITIDSNGNTRMFHSDFFIKVDVKENDIFYVDEHAYGKTVKKSYAAHFVGDKIILRGLNNSVWINRFKTENIHTIIRLDDGLSIDRLYHIIKNGTCELLHGTKKDYIYVKPEKSKPEEEVKEMTMKQVIEALGYEVKIVKDKR